MDKLKEKADNEIKELADYLNTLESSLSDAETKDYQATYKEKILEIVSGSRKILAKQLDSLNAEYGSEEACDDETRADFLMEFTMEVRGQKKKCEKRVSSVREQLRISEASKLAQALKSMSGKPVRIIESDTTKLAVFRIPMKTVFEDKKKHIRRVVLNKNTNTIPSLNGESDPKIIMMVGMTGAGKSLMINNLLNYFCGVEYKDDFRFEIINSGDEVAEREAHDGVQSRSEAKSMTSFVTGYEFPGMPGSPFPHGLFLIDSPGFGDDKGIKHDEEIVNRIRSFFTDEKACPYNMIASIAFVIQASSARLTAEQQYVFNQVLNLFGKNLEKNVSIMFTFADAYDPPALIPIKEHKIPYQETFKFNNSALYAPNKVDQQAEFAWKFGYASVEGFFKHLESVETTDLELTKQVLDNLERLRIHLLSLQPKVDAGMDQLQNMEDNIKVINELTGTMKSNENYTIKKIVHQQETEIVTHCITNCLVCQHTCHSPCSLPPDASKTRCGAMDWNDMCVVCPKKCPAHMHSNGSRIYKYVPKTVTEKVGDMLKKYNIAKGNKDAKDQLLNNLRREYELHKKEVQQAIKMSAELSRKLDEIAMRNSYLTDVAYIENLIELENRGKRANKHNRLQQLRHMLSMAKTLESAKNNPDQLTSNMSEYEKNVLGKISGD